jgi:hypothetical protein
MRLLHPRQRNFIEPASDIMSVIDPHQSQDQISSRELLLCGNRFLPWALGI